MRAESPTTPGSLALRAELEREAPKGARLLMLWRRAIENGAAAHDLFRTMTPGPGRSALYQRLRAFDAQRRRVAKDVSLALAQREGGLPDFEQITGTATLVTDPDIPGGGLTATDHGLGAWFVPILVIGGIASAIVGTYVVSTKLADVAAKGFSSLFWLTVAGVGAWAVYKIVKAGQPPVPALGETYF